jgi:NTP pyrophosphatase (non-canonical NTP hydrolase)
MNQRVKVDRFFIDVAAHDIRTDLDRRLAQHGHGSYIGPHEALGIITEEYDELLDAVRSNDHSQVEKELIDIAVGCLFGVASLRANAVSGVVPPKARKR